MISSQSLFTLGWVADDGHVEEHVLVGRLQPEAVALPLLQVCAAGDTDHFVAGLEQAGGDHPADPTCTVDDEPHDALAGKRM